MVQNLKNIKATALTSVITSVVSPAVKITSLTYPNSATAADPAGSETITVNGSGFNSGVKVYVDTTLCTTTYVSSTSLTFTSPAKSVASYHLFVYNTDGSNGMMPAGMVYSSLPTWVTSAGSLGSSYSGSAISTINLSASENAQTITYAVTSGTLPTGLSLSTSGALTGTPTGSAATYNFTVTATDPQNQTASRNFSYTLNPVFSSIQILVVAGGGGTPTRNNNSTAPGGGGAGGVVIHSSLSVTTSVQYAITVGAGGTVRADIGSGMIGNPGSDSTFASTTIIAKGGGAGGSYIAGGSGGSGGGGGYQNLSGGTATQNTLGTNGGGTGYGHAGGSADTYNTGSPGGGGAGAVGGTTSTARGADGGIGIEWPTSSGIYYGGGGAGGAAYAAGTGAGGTGGTGGGGAGGLSNADSVSYPGSNGATNTGGGGGAASGGSNPIGASGGSGVVIIRYADTYSAATSTTGSPTYTTPTGYRMYKFTSSGSITF
jgi:hypothetical protein